MTSFAKNVGSVDVGSVACRLTGCRLRGIGLILMTVGSLNVGSDRYPILLLNNIAITTFLKIKLNYSYSYCNKTKSVYLFDNDIRPYLPDVMLYTQM